MSLVEITLPWPPKQLQGNGTRNRMARWRIGKQYRTTAYLLTLQAMPREFRGCSIGYHVNLSVSFEFRQPAKRSDGRRNVQVNDDDNLIAAMKSAQDGIADALGVNDRQFRLQRPTHGERVDGGAVVVRIEVQP
jgi:crossover junction endodeoxyribonuclease RusA